MYQTENKVGKEVRIVWSCRTFYFMHGELKSASWGIDVKQPTGEEQVCLEDTRGERAPRRERNKYSWLEMMPLL